VGLTLTVLGCDGGYPGPGGAASGYLIEGGDTRLWVDAGSGSLAAIQGRLDLRQLDAVFISHEHPDHRSDLEGLAVVLAFEMKRQGLPVYAPASLRPLVYHDFPGVFDWRVVADGDREQVAGLSLSFSRTDHGPETLAVRIEGEGRTLGYSADTGPAWSLQGLGPGLDLALCEATWLKAREGGAHHLSARQAGAMAREAAVGRLVLTHRWPTVAARDSWEEGSEAFGSAVEQARAGSTWDV
jgi:ribonuclease BN (tRNA processing enzyme)